MANSKPVSEIRIGSVKAFIWPNDTEGRIRYTVTFSRPYKDGEQWKTTQTFGRNDLLVLAKVADQGTRGSSNFSKVVAPRRTNRHRELRPKPPLSFNLWRAKP